MIVDIATSIKTHTIILVHIDRKYGHSYSIFMLFVGEEISSDSSKKGENMKYSHISFVFCFFLILKRFTGPYTPNSFQRLPYKEAVKSGKNSS